MKDGVNATPLPTVNTTGYIDHAAFLVTINPDTNKIPKHLFQGYLNIYNNYFKAPWMPDRTEANPNELNQDDARYGFRCCHLKNIWTAPLPPETELSRQMTTSTTSIDIMSLQAAYVNLHTDQERDYFMQRYHDVISSFGGKTSYDADNRPLLVMANIKLAPFLTVFRDHQCGNFFLGRVVKDKRVLAVACDGESRQNDGSGEGKGEQGYFTERNIFHDDFSLRFGDAGSVEKAHCA